MDESFKVCEKEVVDIYEVGLEILRNGMGYGETDNNL